MKITYEKVKTFVEIHDRKLGFIALAFGFTVDSLTLTRIDLLLDNLILLGYLTLAGLAILLINIFPNNFFKTWLPLVFQYAFGGLFSGYIIFYTRSASLLASWPFLLMLALLLLGNEFFRDHYRRTAFQLSIYFIAVFSFFIFSTPVYFKEISDQIFLLSGVISLIVMWTLLWILKIATKGLTKSIYFARISMFFIFLAFNALYFTNLIPPIPLSIKEFDIYYNVERSGSTYTVLKEPLPWYKFKEKNIYKYLPGGSLFAYSAIFAPTDIKSDITHVWSIYNEKNNMWEVRDSIKYPIIGGRDGGYRGYSVKTVLEAGKWRVDVKNERGQILGRKKFSVIKGTPQSLIEDLK